MKNFSVCLLIAASCFIACQSNAQTTFLTNGLVLYYPFNGNANDAIGTNDGLVVGATLTNDMFGNPNQAYYFDGNSYIEIPTSTNVFGSEDFSISVWFNPLTYPIPSIPSQAACFLISKGQNNFELSTGAAPTNSAGMTFLPRSGSLWQTPAMTYRTNVWQHVVAVYEPSTMTVKVYLNGVLLTLTGTGTAASSDTTFAARLGMRENNSLAFTGSLDSVRVYNRALSDQEVAQLYKFESGQILSIASLPGLIIYGVPGATESIQYTTNLSAPAWSTLVSNIVLQTSSFLYVDTNALNQPQRFYRVVAP